MFSPFQLALKEDADDAKSKTRHEMYPTTEFFLVRIFPNLEWIWRDTNAGKYGPEKTPHLDTFHAVKAFWWDQSIKNRCIGNNSYLHKNCYKTVYYSATMNLCISCLLSYRPRVSTYLTLWVRITGENRLLTITIAS